MTSCMTTLGARIRAARTKRNLTQEEAADLIGVLANTVSRWERDACAPQGPARKWLRSNWPEVYDETVETLVEDDQSSDAGRPSDAA